MTRPTTEALDETGSIVQSSARHYPGVVFQGDSLLLLLQRIDAALVAVQGQQKEEAIDELEEMKETLAHALRRYVEVLDERGQSLPFTREEFERLTAIDDVSEAS